MFLLYLHILYIVFNIGSKINKYKWGEHIVPFRNMCQLSGIGIAILRMQQLQIPNTIVCHERHKYEAAEMWIWIQFHGASFNGDVSPYLVVQHMYPLAI